MYPRLGIFADEVKNIAFLRPNPTFFDKYLPRVAQASASVYARLISRRRCNRKSCELIAAGGLSQHPSPVQLSKGSMT